MKTLYKSDIFKVLHEAAVAKFEAGAISAEEMRESDLACLAPDVTPGRPSCVGSTDERHGWAVWTPLGESFR